VSVNIRTAACSFLNISNLDLGRDTARLVGEEAKARGWDSSNTTVILGQNAEGGDEINNNVRYFYSTIADILGLEEVDPETITPDMARIGSSAFQFDGKNQMQPAYDEVKSLASSVPAGNNIVLYATNNDAIKGALRALEQRGLADEGRILIGGLGGDAFGLESLANDPRWVAEGDIFVDYWGQYSVGMAQALADGVKPTHDVTAIGQAVYGKELLAEYHPDGSTKVQQLPPLDETNAFLGDTQLFQFLHNVAKP
jgi:ribose transport system substrate-binding protein